MKKLYCLLITVIVLSVVISVAEASERVSAKNFSGADGVLNEQEAAWYLAHFYNEPLSKFLSPGEWTVDSNKVLDAMQDRIDDLVSLTGHDAPWSWQELDASAQDKTVARSSVPGWKKISGLTVEKKVGKDKAKTSLGSIQLRKNESELNKAIANSKGLTLGFSDNRLLNGGGVWNTEGIIGYPIKFNFQFGSGRSTELSVTPAVGWHLAETQGKKNYDINDLTFSIPVVMYFSPGMERNRDPKEEDISVNGGKGFSRLWLVTMRPYFQTDFDFQHKIHGFGLSAEYVGFIFGSDFYMGGFTNIPSTGWQYQLRAVPAFDYSKTDEIGIYTSREAEKNWLRLGGLISFDLRTGTFASHSLDIGTSYRFFEASSSGGISSDLFSSYMTWWLSENAGVTLQYSRGKTLVALQKIDLVTLGFELKY